MRRPPVGRLPAGGQILVNIQNLRGQEGQKFNRIFGANICTSPPLFFVKRFQNYSILYPRQAAQLRGATQYSLVPLEHSMLPKGTRGLNIKR